MEASVDVISGVFDAYRAAVDATAKSELGGAERVVSSWLADGCTGERGEENQAVVPCCHANCPPCHVTAVIALPPALLGARRSGSRVLDPVLSWSC
eukprot:6480553-Amphidinium_carterae.1